MTHKKGSIFYQGIEDGLKLKNNNMNYNMDNNMDNSKMGKLVHIAFVMGSAYALTLVFSHLNHAFRHPNIIELYIKFGPIAILGHYSIPILFFIFILLSFFALLLKNRKILSSPHSNLFISCLLALILVIYTHSLYCLHLTKQQNQEIHLSFKRGSPEWVGWDFYKQQEYLPQTLEQVSRRPNLPQQIQVALEDLDGGLYSLKRWLDNHVLVVNALSLGFKSVGIIALGFIVCLSCLLKLLKSPCIILWLYSVLWGISVLFFGLAESVHSIQTMNSHPLCLEASHSGKFKIVIDKRYQDAIRYQFNLTTQEDPKGIFTHLCQKIAPFHLKVVTDIDSGLIVDVLGLVWIGCLFGQILVFLHIFLGVEHRDIGIFSLKNSESGSQQYEQVPVSSEQ